MFRKILLAHQPCAIALQTMAFIAACSAQGPAKSQPGKNAITGELVTTGLYVFVGGGGNSLLRLSGNGFVLVNSKLPGNYEALVKLTRQVSFSEQPVRVVINTDHYEEHTGNNAKFMAGGAQILAQENVRNNLAIYNRPGEKVALPIKTYDRDFVLHLGGIEVQLWHFGNAHTNGDSVVYFPDLKVVAVGDLFAPTPNPDFSAGGSVVGWSAVLAQILKLDFDVVVPGTGQAVARADLEAFKIKMDTLTSRGIKLVKDGVPKDRLMAELKTDDLGWRFNFTGNQLDRFYSELSQPK